MNRNQVTFHLPLHRYLSILTYTALHEQNADLKSLFPITDEDFLLNLLIHPLRLQALRYELNTNSIWSYNSYELQIQSTMYSSHQGNLAYYMSDADLFLIQVLIATLLPNSLLKPLSFVFPVSIDFGRYEYLHRNVFRQVGSHVR